MTKPGLDSPRCGAAAPLDASWSLDPQADAAPSRAARPTSARWGAVLHACALTLALASCRAETPRYGHVRLEGEAMTATLSGVAGGAEPAADVVNGCVGFVADPDVPDQVIELRQARKVDLTARSTRGPVTLLVVGEDGGGCDDDRGSGHAPTLRILAPGTYRVWVAAREPGRALPYELTALLDDKSLARERAGEPVARRGAAGAGGPVSVTVTSDTPGAEVRTAGGQVLGVTPAIFEYLPGEREAQGPLAFFVVAPGRPPVRVEGTPREGQLVLHAAGTTPRFPVGPGGTGGPPGERISSAVSVRIRDQGTATQSATYAGDCVVASLDVEVDIRHTCPSDLRVQLRSPAGTVVNLQTYAYRRMSPRTFGWRDTRALQRLAGEQARGTWDLIVRDDVDADVGTFESFAITFQCQAGGSATGALPAPAPASAVAPSAGHRGSSEVLDPFGPVPSRPARHRRWLGSSDPLSGLDSRDGNTGGGTNRPVINPWDP